MSRRLSAMDIRELVRQLRIMESDRAVQRFSGLHCKTIGRTGSGQKSKAYFWENYPT